MTQSHIAEHLHVSADSNVITIDPWTDPVTGRFFLIHAREVVTSMDRRFM